MTEGESSQDTLSGNLGSSTDEEEMVAVCPLLSREQIYVERNRLDATLFKSRAAAEEFCKNHDSEWGHPVRVVKLSSHPIGRLSPTAVNLTPAFSI